MEPLTFYIVDVFAETKYAGNQLAVVRNAARLSAEEMQRLAKEMNYSETTVILGETPRNGGYDVRIFTPGAELPFAGHPTLGTAYLIQRELLQTPVELITLNLQAGPIPVTFTYRGEQTDILWMRQNPPTFTRTFNAEPAAAALRLSPEALDTRFPIQEVSTGAPFIIVPLASLKAVQQARVDAEPYAQLVQDATAKNVLIFCAEPLDHHHDLHARVFAPHYGLAEDPATGSANGCLAAYLTAHQYWGEPQIDVQVEQGYQMGRPSLLYLRTTQDAGNITVSVGGKVEMVARGELV
jgi:trans-2,3-dihydro-3-hydroxyanthranilate isomerase